MDGQDGGLGGSHHSILRDVVFLDVPPGHAALRQPRSACPYWSAGLNYDMIVLCIP
jgi:hypothetical protein